MPLLGALGLALALLALLGGGKRPGPARQAVRRVLLIGDSFAVGLERPLRMLADRDLPDLVSFEGHGQTSTTIPWWAESAVIPEVVARFQPSHVLVSLGTNDEKGRILDQDRPAIERLLQTLRSRGAVVAWIGPPSLPFPRAGVSALAQSRADRYFPSEEIYIPRAGDGLHPTGAGYALWADAIWKWLLS